MCTIREDVLKAFVCAVSDTSLLTLSVHRGLEPAHCPTVENNSRADTLHRFTLEVSRLITSCFHVTSKVGAELSIVSLLLRLPLPFASFASMCCLHLGGEPRARAPKSIARSILATAFHCFQLGGGHGPHDFKGQISQQPSSVIS